MWVMRWKWLHSTFKIIKIFSYLGSEARLVTVQLILYLIKGSASDYIVTNCDTITLHTCISLIWQQRLDFLSIGRRKWALQNIASTIGLVHAAFFGIWTTHKTFCDNFLHTSWVKLIWIDCSLCYHIKMPIAQVWWYLDCSEVLTAHCSLKSFSPQALNNASELPNVEWWLSESPILKKLLTSTLF